MSHPIIDWYLYQVCGQGDSEGSTGFIVSVVTVWFVHRFNRQVHRFNRQHLGKPDAKSSKPSGSYQHLSSRKIQMILHDLDYTVVFLHG
jgi:hypothetical protein